MRQNFLTKMYEAYFDSNAQSPPPQGYPLQQVSDAWDASNDYIRFRSAKTAGCLIKAGVEPPNREQYLSTLTPAPDVKEVAVAFMDWVTRKDSPYSICYGSETRLATDRADFTIEKIFNEWYENVYQKSKK